MIPVDFILRASTGAFTRGIAAAENRVQSFRKSVRLAGGAQLGSAIGIYGIVRGFSAVLKSAQDARSEMEKMGRPIDDSVASVANLADGFDGLKTKAASFGISALSVFTRVGDAARRLMQGVTKEQEEEAKRQAESSGKAADAMEKRRDKFMADNSPEKILAAEKKLDDFRRDRALAEAEGDEKINMLLNQRMVLSNELSRLGVGLVERREKELEIERVSLALAKEGRAQAEATAKAERERADLKDRRNKARQDVATATREMQGGVMRDLLPSDQDVVMGGSGSLRASVLRARELDRKAQLFGSQGGTAGLERATQFRTEASEIRRSLSGQVRFDEGTESRDAMTVGFSTALKKSEDELAEINEKLSGIFKAQP